MNRSLPIILSSVVAVALLASGCGSGGGHAPAVASLDGGATTTGTTATTQGSGGPDSEPAGPSGGARGQFSLSMSVGTKDGPKFSSCMRRHGITNFPDPNSSGVITVHSGMGIDPGSPSFRSARSACEKLLPNGGQPTPAQIAQRQRQMLAFSTCMRAHGLKDFPDPSNGGLRIKVHPGSDLDPNNPTFQRAQQACQKYIPFKTPPGTAKAGGG
jgi:hypothetical protein